MPTAVIATGVGVTSATGVAMGGGSAGRVVVVVVVVRTGPGLAGRHEAAASGANLGNGCASVLRTH